MSCNTKTSLAAVIDAVNAQLNNNYVDRDDPRINQGVFTEPTIRGGLMLDEAAKLDFCGYVTECGQQAPFGKLWLDRPLYPDTMLVSYDDAGEIKPKWRDINDAVADTGIGRSYSAFEETRRLGLEGFVIVDSFELGATITHRDQALRHTADGKLYRWAGDIPKVVSAGSTPISSGGVGVDAWVEVSDTTLRSEIVAGRLVTDAIVAATPKVGGVKRNQMEVNNQTVTPYDFGGIGDGLFHPLSERFSSLEAAKTVYPNAESLEGDSIDYHALERFFDYCKNNFVALPLASFKAYVHKMLFLDGRSITTTFYGDLTLYNTQSVYEIEALIKINILDFKFLGKLYCVGTTGSVADRKQLAGVIIGDGDADGSAGRTYIDTVNCYGFRDFGVCLINDSIFPSIRYSYASNIGSIGRSNVAAKNTHNATITGDITDLTGHNPNQGSTFAVSSMPPLTMGKYKFKHPVMLIHAGELYRIVEMNATDNTIKTFPLLNLNQRDVKDIRYIYGTGLGWIGNNSGCGMFGHVQTILCGIGFWGASLYGASISYATSEFCGIGFTTSQLADAVISYTVVNSYFEANAFNYVAQWFNTRDRNQVSFLGANDLMLSKFSELSSHRTVLQGLDVGGRRGTTAFNSSSFYIYGETYSYNKIESSRDRLSSSASILHLPASTTLPLKIDEAIIEKLKLDHKLAILPPHTNTVTMTPPSGWTISGVSEFPSSTTHTILSIRMDVISKKITIANSVIPVEASTRASKGTTAERPVLNSNDVGYKYYDTTLLEAGKPIEWNGEAWVDGAGVAV